MFAAMRAEIKEHSEYRLGRYGSFWHRIAISRWNWSIALCLFEEGWSLHFFCLWIRLCRASREPEEMMESWGASYYSDESSLHLNWGMKYKILHMPWSYDHCRQDVLLKDGSWAPYEPYGNRGFERTPEPPDMYRESFPYRYTLKSGKVQERTATITGERRTWCWRAWPFRKLRWPSKTRTCIDVAFSDEVGERTGSWKGGTVGCGWELLPSETPLQSLLRMERERIFD